MLLAPHVTHGRVDVAKRSEGLVADDPVDDDPGGVLEPADRVGRFQPDGTVDSTVVPAEVGEPRLPTLDVLAVQDGRVVDAHCRAGGQLRDQLRPCLDPRRVRWRVRSRRRLGERRVRDNRAERTVGGL